PTPAGPPRRRAGCRGWSAAGCRAGPRGRESRSGAAVVVVVVVVVASAVGRLLPRAPGRRAAGRRQPGRAGGPGRSGGSERRERRGSQVVAWGEGSHGSGDPVGRRR